MYLVIKTGLLKYIFLIFFFQFNILLLIYHIDDKENSLINIHY